MRVEEKQTLSILPCCIGTNDLPPFLILADPLFLLPKLSSQLEHGVVMIHVYLSLQMSSLKAWRTLI